MNRNKAAQWRRRAVLALFVAPFFAPIAGAQTVDLTDWHRNAVELTSGWVTHGGDNTAWAAPNFDDGGWSPVELDDTGAAQPEWRWFRIHVKLGAGHPYVHLLIVGGDGTYELYVNGKRIDGPKLLPSFEVSRPTERVVWIGEGDTDLELALRTYAPVSYAGWHLPLFLDFELGTPEAIETARIAAQSQRMYAALPSIAINLLVILAGIGAFALYCGQRTHKEYRWLGLYLLLLGFSNLLLYSATDGVLPLDCNNLLGDPLIYFFTIMQIEFTFSFVGQRVGGSWRAYEGLLVAMLIPCGLTAAGMLSASAYTLVEAGAILPAALLLPVLLTIWYWRGKREAGWLIVPSLLPATGAAIFDLGTASIFTGWGRLDFLANPIPVGPISLQLSDVGDFLFVLAIGVVMFLRFTSVSREQAHAAAELDAAREIQRRMVPAQLPAVAGYAIEAAYFPATEVGGDFYQVLGQRDGSTLVVVGDVSGKGLQAAMTCTLALGALRTLAGEGLGPAELLTRLNEQLVPTQETGFITCVCVRIAPDGNVTAANAGHLIPYRNGEEIAMESGLPLGISADSQYPESALMLTAGDMLTLLSDGVVEARTASGELFGFARTQEISRRRAQEIAEAARQFGQRDDITVLTLTGTGIAHA